MKAKLLFFLILISSINPFIRKLNEAPTDLETSEPETTLPYEIPRHPNDRPSSTVEIKTNNIEETITIESTQHNDIPRHPNDRVSDTVEIKSNNIEDSINIEDSTHSPSNYTSLDSNSQDSANEDSIMTTIPTVISEPEYPSDFDSSLSFLILIEIGYFRGPFIIINNPFEVSYTFIVYYYKINFFYPLPIYMSITLTISFSNKNKRKGFFRALQEDQEDEEGQKDIEAHCIRYTYDLDNNVRYNCSFPLDVNQTILNITTDGKAKFEVSNGKFEPIIKYTSYANKTMFEDGIQSRTDDGILKNKKMYILNNTILEENGLKFKLTGESLIPFDDKKAILSFDEKGNGKIKNATCDIYKIEGNIYEFDCTANENINAELNGASGKTYNTDEDIVIVMKSDSDTILNANSGNNYRSYYDRKSSSGLTGGAIAGIVIGCIIALLAIAIGGMLCRRNKVPAPFQESTLGINVSNNTSEND